MSNQIDLLDFDMISTEEGKILTPQEQQIQSALLHINQERIENPSQFFRNKQIQLEKQSIKQQIEQMINHLNQMKNICERKMEKCDKPQKALQNNMAYLKKYTFYQIKDLINKMNSFKNQSFPNDLFEMYQLFEVKMEQFYQSYNNLYFDIKMFNERSKFYLNEDNERDIKLIQQIINN